MGRTSTYKPEYAIQARDFVGSGHSIEAFAAEIGVAKRTVYNWKEAHEDFAEMLEEGEGLRRKLIESALLKLGLTGVGNVGALIFLAKNWCGMRDDYAFDHTSGGSRVTFGWQSSNEK